MRIPAWSRSRRRNRERQVKLKDAAETPRFLLGDGSLVQRVSGRQERATLRRAVDGKLLNRLGAKGAKH